MAIAAIREVAYRPCAFAPRTVLLREEANGTLHLRNTIALEDYGRSVCDYLVHWAHEAPERLYLARLVHGQGWVGLTYAEVWDSVQRLGQAFLDRGLRADRPIAILSSNSIEHALVALAAMAVGVPVAPISPNYSLMTGGRVRLAEIAALLQPGLVFVQSATVLAGARDIPALAAAEWVTVDPAQGATPFSELLSTPILPSFEAAFSCVGPDTVAKILFTSGSTGSPKGVINTQRMLCSGIVMSALMVPPMDMPVQVEWMPWHHTMGGNAQFNSILRSGGTLCIDEGRPTPEAFAKTVASLSSISPTSLQTVPLGFSLLIDALHTNEPLRRSFFQRIQRISYGGAALPDGLIQRFQAIAVESVGERIAVMSGYGTTETAPTICVTNWPSEASGEIGLPAPGIDVKLLPVGDRYEIRVRGPNVTPGYLGRPDLTAAAFDEEGYYRVGDALTFTDRERPEQGLRFAGRLSENFKLSSGTWVLASDLRLAVVNAVSPALRDVVVVGENRDEVAILAWINPAVPDDYLADASTRSDSARLIRDPKLVAFVKAGLVDYNQERSSSSRIAAFTLLAEPPSLADGEITDKGYINQRGVAARRRVLVDALFVVPAPDGVHDLRPNLIRSRGDLALAGAIDR